MRILCDKPTSEADSGIQPEGGGFQAGTSRSQRTRNMHAKLQECVITSNDVVNNEYELIHYAFYGDT